MTAQQLIDWAQESQFNSNEYYQVETPTWITECSRECLDSDNSSEEALFDAIVSQLEWRMQQVNCTVPLILGEM